MILKNLCRPSLNSDYTGQQSFDICSDVAKELAELYETTPEKMLSKLRNRWPTMARQMSMYVLDKLGIQRTYITWFFNRDRTTLYNSLKCAQNTIDLDSRVGDTINNIITKYKND